MIRKKWKMKKILFFIIGILLILPLVSALDYGLPISCGGDEQLVIMCGPADINLTWLSREVPPEVWSGIGGGGVEVDIEDEEEVEEPEEEKFIFPLFSILGLDKIEYDDPEFWGFMLILFFLPILFIFIYKKKKKKKQTEGEKEEIPTRIKEKDNIIFIVIAIIVVIFLVILFTFPEKVKEPEEISKGLHLKIYDKDGNEIDIPEWFLTISEDPLGIFSIVRHPPAPDCTTTDQCSGHDTNPNIMCWKEKCVLGNVDKMDLGVSVENPSDSEVAFTNVAPSSASPSAFWTNLDKTPVSKLSPGDPIKSWVTTTPISVGIWEGTTQTFTVEVSGTNEYTGLTFSTSDSITLAIDADPTGVLIASIVSPVPSIEDCIFHDYYSCYNSDVYWYDSCGVREDKKTECGSSAYTGSNYCYLNDVYRDYITRGCSGSSCTESTSKIKQVECGAVGCSNGVCCTSHTSYSCYDDDVYWYDGCGVREEKKEECEGGCTGNRCRVWVCEIVILFKYCRWV